MFRYLNWNTLKLTGSKFNYLVVTKANSRLQDNYILSNMKAFICVISLFGILCFSLDGDKISYRAAVYEHAVVLPKERKLPVNRSVALENMMKNIVIYGNQVKLAANQVGHLIFYYMYYESITEDFDTRRILVY